MEKATWKEVKEYMEWHGIKDDTLLKVDKGIDSMLIFLSEENAIYINPCKDLTDVDVNNPFVEAKGNPID